MGEPSPQLCARWIPSLIPGDPQIYCQYNRIPHQAEISAIDSHSREQVPTPAHPVWCSMPVWAALMVEDKSGTPKGQCRLGKCSAGSLPSSNHTQHPRPVWFRGQPHLKRARLAQLGAGEVLLWSHISLCLCLLAFPALPCSQLMHQPLLFLYFWHHYTFEGCGSLPQQGQRFILIISQIPQPGHCICFWVIQWNGREEQKEIWQTFASVLPEVNIRVSLCFPVRLNHRHGN